MKRTLLTLTVLALTGVALYALAGLLLAPRVIERKFAAIVEQDTVLTLAIGAVTVNPFTLTLSLTNVTLFRPENTPVVSIERFDAHVRVASLRERAWLLGDVVVERPHLHLQSGDHGAHRTAANERRPVRPSARPDIVVSVDDALLLHPFVDFGHGFAWSAERLTSDARVEHRRGYTRIEADLAVRALDIGNSRNHRSILTVSSIDGRGVVVETAPTAISIEAAQFDNPRLRLIRAADGTLDLPPGLRALFPQPVGDRASVARLEVSGGSVDFTDQRLTPAVRLSVDDLAGAVTQGRIGRHTSAAVSLRGRLSDAGTGEITAEWLPSRPREATRVEVNLQAIELRDISPYVAEVIGRRIVDGRMDLAMDLVLDEADLDLDNWLVVRDLRFGSRVDDPPAPEVPAVLAAALLEDSNGVIALRVPIADRHLNAAVDPAAVFSRAVGDYVTTLVATPFELLAELVGRPALDLGRLAFPPGSADVAGDTRTKLAALHQVLALRPRLGLTVYPGFDPVADRDALAREQIRLHVNLATSAITPTQAAGKPIEFDDPQVRNVLDEFAQSRLPQSRQSAIAGRFPDRDTLRYRAIFEALVDNEDVTRSALDRLARYRARSIVEALVTSGNDSSRVWQAEEILLAEPGDSRVGVVRLEVRHHDPGGPFGKGKQYGRVLVSRHRIGKVDPGTPVAPGSASFSDVGSQ